MLMILGVEVCGEELRWEDVRPFVKIFERLDVSKTGRITGSDLEVYAKQEAEKRKELSQIKNSKKRVEAAVSARNKLTRCASKASFSVKATGPGSKLAFDDVVESM